MCRYNKGEFNVCKLFITRSDICAWCLHVCKRLTSECPQLQTSEMIVAPECCSYTDDTDNCGMRFYGPNSDMTTYTDCSGVMSCVKTVSWNDTLQECNQSVYLPQTNFMRMMYHCIEGKTHYVGSLSVVVSAVFYEVWPLFIELSLLFAGNNRNGIYHSD